MTTLLLAILAYVAFALHQAHKDRNGKPNNAHAPDWIYRAFVAYLVAGMLTVGDAMLGLSSIAPCGFRALSWRFAGICFVAYGVFTPVFRWRLNRLRGKKITYLSRSNVYDTVFLFVACAPKKDDDLVALAKAMLRYWRRAGLIAYAVEIIALFVGIWITLKH